MKSNTFDETAKTVFERNFKDNPIGETQGLFGRLTGCWHLQMSTPRTIGKITFRFCKKCGMRRKYNLETLKYEGSFYSDPIR